MTEQKTYTMNLGLVTAASDMNVATVPHEYRGLEFLQHKDPRLYEQIMSTKDQIWTQINVLFGHRYIFRKTQKTSTT